MYVYFVSAVVRADSLFQFGGPLAVAVFLIVISAAGEDHLNTVWRVCFGIGIALPLTVFYFRIRMLSSKLYRKGAIKSAPPFALYHPALLNVKISGRVPYNLVIRRYWKPLIGTCGAWFLYDFVSPPCSVRLWDLRLSMRFCRSPSPMASSLAPSSPA